MKKCQKTTIETDYKALYDKHADYTARRIDKSFEHQQINIEVEKFKIPNLAGLLDAQNNPKSLLEIGCATGELVSKFPLANPELRYGCDISSENITTAQRRYPNTHFKTGDFRSIKFPYFEVVILSDVLEHVEDDAAFLRDASMLGSTVLVNLPLECNWLNSRRKYGPSDISGHLRRYTLEEGLALFARAGLNVKRWNQVWIHELPVDIERRALRREMLGQAYSGSQAAQWAKAAIDKTAKIIKPFGRRLHASTLFAAAERLK